MKPAEDLYALYDTKDHDLRVFIGTIPQIAEFFRMAYTSAYRGIRIGSLFKNRYRAEKIERELKDDQSN